MLSIRRVALIYTGLVLLAAVQSAWYYPRLPHTVASHFNGSGDPDGWMSRGAFVTVNVGMAAIVALIMLVMYAIFAKASLKLMNLPNKPYWTAPQREGLTRAILTGFALRFGLALLVFLEIVSMMALSANLAPNPRMSNALWPCLAGFLAFVLIQVIWMIWRFYRVPTGVSGASEE